MKNSVIDNFWNIYEVEGVVQALSYLEALKYYEEYCQDDIEKLTNKLSDTRLY
jgi:hypothetical protein